MRPRRAGEHARRRTRAIAGRYLVFLLLVLGTGVISALLLGWRSPGFVVVEVAAIFAMVALDRLGMPVLDCWDRGAAGEEEVGHLLTGLEAVGWTALHDVYTGRGNIDHVLIGPGGVLTIETKSHRGMIAIDRVDERMLKQAYAQRKWVERLTGQRAEALLVFSNAYLDRPLGRRRGVLVMSSRVLIGYLAKRARCLNEAQIAELRAALSEGPS